MKKTKKALIYILVAGIYLTLIGCSVPKAEKVNVDEVKEYAELAAEKILSGINEENYIMFSEDFDQKMKDAITEGKFQDIVNQLGKHEAREIIGADKIDGYTRVYYKTKFSKISKDVTLTIVFSATEDRKVSGLFYK